MAASRRAVGRPASASERPGVRTIVSTRRLSMAVNVTLSDTMSSARGDLLEKDAAAPPALSVNRVKCPHRAGPPELRADAATGPDRRTGTKAPWCLAHVPLCHQCRTARTSSRTAHGPPVPSMEDAVRAKSDRGPCRFRSGRRYPGPSCVGLVVKIAWQLWNQHALLATERLPHGDHARWTRPRPSRYDCGRLERFVRTALQAPATTRCET
jgi:hypothetical protein